MLGDRIAYDGFQTQEKVGYRKLLIIAAPLFFVGLGLGLFSEI